MTDTSKPNFQFTRISTFDRSSTGKRPSGRQIECRTSTFYMHLPAPAGQKIDLKEVQTLPNGNFILAGNITLDNAQQEGFIHIMTNEGNVVMQKRIRIGNKSTTIFSIKILLSGQIALAGIVHDTEDKVFVSLLDIDFSDNWVKTFSSPSTPVKVTLDIFEEEKLAVAFQLADSIIFSLLAKDGSVLWSRQENPAGINELVGFSALSSVELCLVVNSTRNGKKVVDVFGVLQTDGSIYFSNIIGDGADENKFFEANVFGYARIIAPGITKMTNGQFELTRNIFYSSEIIETKHNYSIPGNINFNVTGATDNAGDALGFCLPEDGKLVFIRHFAYYQTSPEHTRQYNVPIGSGIAGISRSFIDGGYIFGLNTAAANEVILIKTDSIGSLPGCGYTAISNDYHEVINSLNNKSGFSKDTFSLASEQSTISSVLSSVASVTDCNQIYCPPPPADDTCLSSYYKVFRSNSYVDAFSSYYLMQNNNQLAVTVRYDRVLGSTNQLTYGLKLFDERGDYLKGVNLFINGSSAAIRTRQIDDRHIMVIYNLFKNNVPCYSFTLINDDLQVVWTKTIQTFAGYNFYSGGPGIGDITSDNEGNYYFVANTLGFGENAKVLACKLDGTGNPLWVKVYELQGAVLLSSGITATNSSIVIICEGGPVGSYSVRLDKTTGRLQNSYKFQNSSAGAVYNRLIKFDTDRIFYAGNNGQETFTMGLFDTTGMPLKLKHFDQAASITRAATVKAGKLYAMYSYHNGTSFKDVLLKTDSALLPEFIHEFDIMRFGYPSGLGISENGSIYSGGNYSYGGVNGSYYDPYIKKFDPNGSLGTCGFVASNPVISDVGLNISTPVYSELQRSFTTTDDIILDLVPDTSGQKISEVLCSSIPTCASVDINGTDVVCQLTKTYTYTASVNQGCTLNPQWLYDTAYAVLQNFSASTADFKFKKAGGTWLKAKLNAGCSSYIDSFFVEIQNVPLFFSLGDDHILCPGDSIVLNAGQGFNSYKWQDGSTNTTFTVRREGKYFVRVDNLCGDVFTDTIQISMASIPLLDIGNDSSVCITDTLTLKANPGFLEYVWQPSSLFKNQGQKVYAVPSQNEIISLTATTAEGCTAFDTLKITAIAARPVFLGNDTSFCASHSIQLTVPPSYLQYLWHNGNNTSSMTVNQAGSYWVQATDMNGCTAKDTLIVKQVYGIPVFSLGDDFDLCENAQLKLDPGSFSEYLWQDGSAGRYYTVTTPGDFWVTVSNDHGCIASDTILLKNILPSPSGFLKPTDSLCVYDKLDILPLMNFSSYEWSTGSFQSSITVEKPGLYTLRAKDSNGCTGSDTVLVTQKNDCYSDVYIPTAFTPNGDHLNDVFKARLPGTVTEFRLEVYNRNGEKVFVTTDPQNGWNGIINGTLQPSSVFVWQCFYQLPGSKPSYKKGTVTLIR